MNVSLRTGNRSHMTRDNIVGMIKKWSCNNNTPLSRHDHKHTTHLIFVLPYLGSSYCIILSLRYIQDNATADSSFLWHMTYSAKIINFTRRICKLLLLGNKELIIQGGKKKKDIERERLAFNGIHCCTWSNHVDDC